MSENGKTLTDTELWDWAETHPEAFRSTFDRMWEMAGEGFREVRFATRTVVTEAIRLHGEREAAKLVIADFRYCGAGAGVECCAYLMSGEDGAECGRAIAAHKAFIDDRVQTMHAKRQPREDYPDCQLGIGRQPFWMNFQGHEYVCIEAADAQHAHDMARRFVGKEPTSCERLPYPAEPRVGVKGRCPSFCYTPSECAGRTSCPKPRACSE